MKYVSNYSPEQWQQIIVQAETSGMRRKDWLEVNGISKDQFYYWKTKLRNQNAIAPIVPAESSELIEVPIVKPKKDLKSTEFTTSAIIHLGKISIELNNNASAEFIENLGRMIHNAL